MSTTFDHSTLEAFRYVPPNADLRAIVTLTFVSDGMIDIFLGNEQYRLRQYHWVGSDVEHRFTADRRTPVLHKKNGQWIASVKRDFVVCFAHDAHYTVLHDKTGALVLVYFTQGRSGNKLARLVLYPGSVGYEPEVELIGWRNEVTPIIPQISGS